MSSLWDYLKLLLIKKFQKINIMPSPTFFFQKAALKNFIERISLPIFAGKKVRASMTVEASIVLPIFIFFFVSLSSSIEMIRLHGNIQMAMWDIGNKMSIYGGVLDSEANDNGVINELSDIAFTGLYVKKEMTKKLGEKYLNESPLLYGGDGLQFAESEIFTSKDTFEVTVTYAVGAWSPIPSLNSFRMANKYYGHVWNGYGIDNQAGSESMEGETVYITETGYAYHVDRNCSHIELTIREVSPLAIGNERNSSGGRYASCERCAKGIMPVSLYICEDGDRYHYKEDCPGLVRTIYSMRLTEAIKKYKPCSRCIR